MRTIMNIEEAINARDRQKLLAQYSQNAKVWTSSYDGTWNMRLYERPEFDRHVMIISLIVEGKGLKIKWGKPLRICVSGDQACVTIRYEFTSIYSSYVEKGVQYYELEKHGSEWLITKSCWNTTYTNHPMWNPKKGVDNVHETAGVFSPECKVEYISNLSRAYAPEWRKEK